MASHCNGLLIVISKEEIMKKTSMMLVLMVVAVCLTATTALAAQIVLEERIDSVTGSPVKEEFSFYGYCRVQSRPHRMKQETLTLV